ncbi:efflux transporter outer membrane subunit [bacterium]|nr:efflux transporter outer membrane subunit [bacterium]MBU1881469.1 efflux transporter outer membrane subunit [bacterium]
MKMPVLKHNLIWLILAGAILSLSGCAGWRPVREAELPPAPEQYLNASLTGDACDDAWWEVFADPALDSLMLEMFSRNLTLEQAVARLDQSRAGSVAARAGWFPAIMAQGSYVENGEVEDEASVVPNMALDQDPFSGSLAASYEIDVWGKVAAGYAAAHAGYHASHEELRALTITMSAQLARSYYLVTELSHQLHLLNQTVTSYQNSFTLVLSRYNRGIVTSQDVYQSKTLLASAKAQRTLVDANLKTAQHGLSVLLVEYPRNDFIPYRPQIPTSLETIPVGVPSDLINRRPDVRAAYFRMISADRSAAEAVAARLPSFWVTGSLSQSGEEIKDLLNPEGMIWSVIGNVTAPLFQGGRLQANSARAEALFRESLSHYKATVLNAYYEVENALVRLESLSNYVNQLEVQVASAEASLRLTNQNYLRGITNYLNVVVAQTTYFNARNSLIAAQIDLVDAYISLSVAVGGGWTDEMIEQYILSQE